VKPRSFFSILATGAIALLIIGGLSLVHLLQQSPINLLQGGTHREPQAAIFVPKQAPVMVSMLVNPDRLDAFARYLTIPAHRHKTHSELQKVKHNLLARTGLDYKTEIRPWLGEEITLAVTDLDFDRIAENGAQPGYFLAVETQDSDRAREFLQAAYSQQAIAGTVDLLFESYKGVKLIAQRFSQPMPQRNLTASAVVGNFVLFANDVRILKTAINQLQVPDLSLKFIDAYREVAEAIADPRLGLAYVNFPALSAWIANLPLPELPELTQTLTVALSLQNGGIVAQTALLGVDEDDAQPVLSEPVGALSYVPANSLLTVSGTDLQSLWHHIESELPTDSPLQQLLVRSVDNLGKSLGLELPEAIFSWVDGEYSLALLPATDRQGLDWLFVAEKTASDWQGAIANLDRLAGEQGFNVGQLSLLDGTVTAWTKLQTTMTSRDRPLAKLEAQVSGVHGESDRYVILATSLAAFSQSLTASAESLPPNATFQRAIAALPAANDGYLYLDWQGLSPILTQQVPLLRVVELPVQPFFDNLRSLVVTSQGSNRHIRRSTLFFNLGVAS
jgi:hypothetical protein